jgi:hypothetical protein
MLCAPASAQIFRAYLSTAGSDGNPCTLAAPCRLLPAALAAVATGGEIWMLDSANFNISTVNITKSVTILAIPGAVGSVVATGGGNAITINTPSVKVTLKNLVIVHLTSSNDGIQFAQGAELNVEDCEVANIQGNGVTAFAPGSKFTVKNTRVRDSNAGVNVSSSVTASLDGVHLAGNVYGVATGPTSHVTVSNSVMSGGTYGVLASTFGAGTLRLSVERSVSTGNLYGVRVDTSGASDVAEVTVSQSNLTHNTTAAVYANQINVSSTQTVVLDGNTVTDNAFGVLFNNTPIVYTRGNNTMKFNTGGDVSGGSLTALAGQ